MGHRASIGLVVLFLSSLLAPALSNNPLTERLQAEPVVEFTTGSNHTPMNGFQVGSIYSRQTVAFPEANDAFCEINDGAVWCWMAAWDYNADVAQVVPDGRTAVSINGQGMGPYCVILDDGSLSCFHYFDADEPDFNKTVVQLPNNERALTVGIGGVNDDVCATDFWACDEHNDNMACALTDAAANNIYCFPLWDEQGHMGQTNTYGELGLGHRDQTGADPNNASSPEVTTGSYAFTALDIDGKRATAISIGDRHACAIVESDVVVHETFTAEVYCWGNNAYGQLGNGLKSADNGSIPYPHDPWKFIDGEAVRINGSYNKSFIRGFGNFTPIKATVLGGSSIVGEQFTRNVPIAIDATGATTCVLLLSTEVTCWGGTFWEYNNSMYETWYNQSNLDLIQPGRHANVPYSMSSIGHVQTLSTENWELYPTASPPIGLYNSKTQVCVQYDNGATNCWQKNSAVETTMRRNLSFTEDPAFPAWGPEFGTYNPTSRHAYWSPTGPDLAPHEKRISIQEGWDSLNNQERMICGLMENGTAFCYDTAQEHCELCLEGSTVTYISYYNQMFSFNSRHEMVTYGENEWGETNYWPGEREINDRDTDNDGWPRMTDLCPNEAGPGLGCPDMDGDNVPDAFDADKDGDGAPNHGGDIDPIDPCVGYDTDGDGLTDKVGSMFDGSTCDPAVYVEDLDDDNDGILDAQDLCQKGEQGWTSTNTNDNDGDGCKDSSEDVDDDNDRLSDGYDACPRGESYWTFEWELIGSAEAIDYDGDGCLDSTEDLDDDGDGVSDEDDRCPRGTMFEGISRQYSKVWTSVRSTDHDSDGCHDIYDDDDDDGDGQADDVDVCERGEVGWRSSSSTDHDLDGCQDSGEDTDDDNDLILDADDACPVAHHNGDQVKYWNPRATSTRSESGSMTYYGGWVLVYPDREGCADSDGDSVPDVDDYAPNDPEVISMPAILTTSIASGLEHSCAISEDRSKVYCWGNNVKRAVGVDVNVPEVEGMECRGKRTEREILLCGPIAVTEPATSPGNYQHLSSDQGDVVITMVTAGEQHTCAIVSNTVIVAAGSKGGTVVCWGASDVGQTGNGIGGWQYDTQQPYAVPGVTNATNIAAGKDHTCAVLVDNSMRCWGLNDHGQLGRGEFSSSTSNSGSAVMVDSPDRIVSTVGCYNGPLFWARYLHCEWHLDPWNHDAWGERVMDIAAGAGHTCVLTVPERPHYDAEELAWERKGSFRTAQNWTGAHPDPENRFVKDTSNVYCWGDNTHGQLGRTGESDDTPLKTATIAGGASFVIAMDAYDDRTCVVLNTGTVHCWGYGLNGITQIDLDGVKAKSITVGRYHDCIIDHSNSVHCWGDNDEEQLGNLASLNNNVNQIDAGHLHTCAVLKTNQVKCWGENGRAQLGTRWNSDPLANPQTASGVTGALAEEYAIPPPATVVVEHPVEPPVFTPGPTSHLPCHVLPVGYTDCLEDAPVVGSRSTPSLGAGGIALAMAAAVFVIRSGTKEEEAP